MKKYNIIVTEELLGQLEVEAKNKKEAEEKFWEQLKDIDMGSVMDTSDGFRIKAIEIIK